MKLKISHSINELSEYQTGTKYSTEYLYICDSPRLKTKNLNEFSYRFNRHKNRLASIILNGKIK